MPTPKMEEDAKLKRWHAEDEVAKDIIEEARIQLMLKFRFLDLALWRMELEPHRDELRYPLATTGKKVYTDSPRVIARYTEDYNEATRDYLHSVMHCVFRHPYEEGYTDTDAWWLACDIIVESVIIDMIGGRFKSAHDQERVSAINEIRMLVGMLVPGKMYTLLHSAMNAPEGTRFRGIDELKIAEWRYLFERDDHGPWPAAAGPGRDGDDDENAEDEGDNTNPDGDVPDEGKLELDSDEKTEDAMPDADGSDSQNPEESNDDDGQKSTGGEEPDKSSQGQSGESDESEDDQQDKEENSLDNDPSQQMSPAGDNADNSDDERDMSELEQEEKDWEEISKHIEMDLEMFSKEWGNEASNLVASLEVSNRKKYSYTDFLRSFMTVNEAMKLDMDEFDYIYYTYGMDMYGNTPLIEPLEYKDTHQIKDFVLAVDTSESTSGELVRKFIQHTFDILKESENFSREVNIHIIQCDNKVQSDTKITDIRQVDALMEDFHIRGFGGTDFRPAFDYVEGLRARGDLKDVKGMIYFTDGLGRFPEKAPDYDAAFVFMTDGDKVLPPVPPWAIKVTIDEHAINKLRPGQRGQRKKKKKNNDEEMLAEAGV